MLPSTIRLRDIPVQPGCMVYLLRVEGGGAIDAAGDVPTALAQAKWVTVHHYSCIVWENGVVRAALIACEDGLPPSLECLQGLILERPEIWEKLPLLETGT